MLKKTYKFSYISGIMLIIISMLLSITPTDPAMAAGNPGTLWTTTVACGGDPVDSNHFAIGANIYLHLRGFDPNTTQAWSIKGAPGGGSCDPGIAVASGNVTFDANGDACFLAYTVLPDDCGEYQVKVGTKGDNYRVDEAAPPVVLSMDVTKAPNVSSVPYTGGDVTFTITITNTGNQDLTITGVSDSVFSSLGSCPGLIGTTLLVGQSTTCSFTGPVTGTPGTNHNNTFTVDAVWEQQPVSASGSAVVAINPLPALLGSVQKTANPISIETGGTVIFTVVVSNTSVDPIDLTSLVDDVYGPLNGQGNCSVPQTIAAGGSYSCSFPGLVTGGVGEVHTNTVTADVSMGTQNATWQDSADVTIVAGPSLSLNVTKVPSQDSVQQPGDNVTFTIMVENTSNVEVTLSSLTDTVFDLGTQGNCSVPQTLAVGESYSCEVTSNISAAHENTVTATISYPDQDDVSDSATAVVAYTERPAPTITVVKSANPTSMDEPGGPVAYTVDITNTSNFSVRLDSISDNRFGNLIVNLPENGNCPGLAGVEITAGASVSCSFTRDVAGTASTSHVNTVTVTVHDLVVVTNTAVGTDDETVTFVALPTILATKTVNPTSLGEYGGDATFTITVNNTSTEPLQLNSLTDTVFGDLDGMGDCSIPQDLAVSGSYSCSFTVFLDGDVGTDHVNVMTATAVDSDNNETFDSDDAVVTFEDQLPTITVLKTALSPEIDEPGGSVTFSVQVTNNSGEPVTLDSLIDDQFGNLDGQGTCAVAGLIAPGAMYSCQFSGLVQGNAGDTHTNIVNAVASDNEGNDATGNDSETVTLTNVLTLIEVIKTASPTAVTEPGGDVTFTVTVNNLTNEDVTLTSLMDDIFNNITTTGHDGITATTCATGGVITGFDSYSCSFTAPVNGNAGFIHINTVTAIAVDNDQTEATDSDSAQVDVVDQLPTIQVIKLADPTSAPAPVANVSFSIEVVNNSVETVTLDSLVDDRFGDLNGVGNCVTGGDILPGESYACTFEQSISGQSGDTHTNVITAIVSDNENNQAQDSDDAVVTFTPPPQLVLVDPCSVGCDLPNVTGELCNDSLVDDYNGTITWDTYVDTTRIGGGTVLSIPAGACVDLSTPRQGNGMYSITVTFVDENNRTLETSCGPLSCTQPPVVTPTPVPPVTPPTGTSTVFIPVTGFDFSHGGLISMFQNLGFALVSVGLVVHGLSLNGSGKKKSKG